MSDVCPLLSPLRGLHSWEDWDFSTDGWTMSEKQYKAAKCSLHPVQADRMSVLLKTSVIPNSQLIQGRAVMWFYHTSSGAGDSIGFSFRYQDVLNRYTLHLRPGTNLVYFERVLAGAYTRLKSVTWNYALNTWHKIRVTWWNDTEWGGFLMKLERWTGSEWVDVIALAYDKSNYWGAAGGRTGFSHIDNTTYFDDVELWGIP